MPIGPDYRGRSPEEIISEKIDFDSVGYIYRALSWLDVAERSKYNVCALQYAAHDTRQGIEQFFFEELVLCVGTDLDRKEYAKCKGRSTKLKKTIKRLNPNYKKLAEFTQAIISVNPIAPNLIIWDHELLMKYWGKISKYLHWAGEPAETTQSEEWVLVGIETVKNAANYIRGNNLKGYTGIMMPGKMQPEIRKCWDRFNSDEIDINAVKRTANIALPILKKRS